MKSFKIPKDHSEAVTRGTDNTMDTCNITKGQTMIYKNKFQKAKQFCFTCDTRRVCLVTDPVVSHE